MKQTVFFGDKPVYLVDNESKQIALLEKDAGVLVLEKGTKKNIAEALQKIDAPEISAILIKHSNFEKLIKNFNSHFKLIDAAGGIVQNEDKDILFIYRRGKWDLPKGKVDAGESKEDAAEREVTEETGVINIKRKKKIGKTYHTYFQDDEQYLKTTHWYYFDAKGTQNLLPQINEDIEEAKWISTRDIRTPMLNTYPNIKWIMSEFFDTP